MPPSTTAPPAQAAVTCAVAGDRCPVIAIAGDPPSATPTFTGHADPGMLHDPVVPGRIWLLYSSLEGRRAVGDNGRAVGIPVVSTHLARSDDGGATWHFERALWSSPLSRDPEARGADSYYGSETPSITGMHDEAGTTWFSVRLSYFLEPVTAYKPRYGSSWTMHVAAARAASPAALATAPEAVLGTSTTSPAYGPTARLTDLDPSLRACGMWNNPSIVADGGRLYVLAECLVFTGAGVNDARSRVVVFRTLPVGAPSTWTWQYAGVLVDQALARSLGGDRVVSPEVSRGRDGALLLVVSPYHHGESHGCDVILLDALDPPRVRRDGSGAPVIRARQDEEAARGWHTGACTHDPASATGLITVASSTQRGLRAELRTTGLQP